MPTRRTADIATATTAATTLLTASARLAGIDVPPELAAALATLLGYTVRCIVR